MDQKFTRSEMAKCYFMQGYNCTQAVVLAFADLVDIDRKQLLSLASSFGGGMGRLREVCGTVSGMFIIQGLLNGYTTPETGKIKADHYAAIQQLAHRFEEEHGSIICRDLLGLTVKSEDPTPEQRTNEYYQKRPCPELVASAVGILEDFLGLTQNSDENA